jgi:hypothetical protein
MALNAGSLAYSGLVARALHRVKCASLVPASFAGAAKTVHCFRACKISRENLPPKYAAARTDCGRRSFRIHVAEWRFMKT